VGKLLAFDRLNIYSRDVLLRIHDDPDYSDRVGRMKVLFTRALRGVNNLPEDVCESRRKHRESDVWQRRFYEHTIRDELDFRKHLDYLHCNPVKHGLVKCVPDWQYSSFHRGVRRGEYDRSNHYRSYF
jgi:putative transposase